MLNCVNQLREGTMKRAGIASGARSRATGTHTRTPFMSALIGVALLVVPQVSYAQGLVMSDGYESGTTDQWNAESGRPKCPAVRTAVDGVPVHSGNYMMECNWDGVSGQYSTVILQKWDYSREFLVRFWVRYAADVDRVGGNKLMRFYPHDGFDSFYLAAQMEKPGGPLFSFWEQINGGYGPEDWGDGSPFGDNKWHKIEIYMKHNTAGSANGTVRIWQDGLVKDQASNIVTVASGRFWYPMFLMSNWSGNPGWEHDANNHTYWDDIEVFTDLGTGASGLMSDASIKAGGSSAPASPTNLRIVQ